MDLAKLIIDAIARIIVPIVIAVIGRKVIKDICWKYVLTKYDQGIILRL